MFGIGAGEFVLILIVGLIVFGPSKLPEVGRSLGKAIREFRKAQSALTNALSETEAQITAPIKSNTQSNNTQTVNNNQSNNQSNNQPANNQNVETPRTTVADVTDMINANPITVNTDKVALNKTDAVKES